MVTTTSNNIKTYKFCFVNKHGYKPIMRAIIIDKNFSIKKGKNKLSIKSFEVNHGLINATGYVMEKIGYLSDCNNVPKKNLIYLKNLDYLIAVSYTHLTLPTILLV